MLEFNGTILFVIISFIIFVFLMNLLCYKPLLKLMAKREELFAKNKQTVLDTNSKKENIIKEIESEISKAKLESSKLLKNASDFQKAEKEEKIKNKKLETINSINDFEVSLNNETNAVCEQLKTEIVSYAKSVVSKVVGVNYDEVQIDDKLAQEILK